MKHIIFVAAFFAFLPAIASAATLTLGGPAQVTVGETFSIPVILSTEDGESANAVSATINYPSQLLTLVSISKAASIITLWPQDPSISDASGQFEGVILNPGWSGTNGVVATLTFRAKVGGNASLAFADASVLANDGKGTPILSGTTPRSITVSAQASVPVSALPTLHIISSTDPDQTKWYNKSTVSLDWTPDSGATSVRIGYDKDLYGTPSAVYTADTTHKDLVLKDGIWYFHVQELVGGQWSNTSTFKIQIDTTPPNAVNIRFPHGSTTNDPRPVALFNTTDNLSGISGYTVTVNGNGIVRLSSSDVTSNPYAVPVQGPGTSTLTVVAYDNAGNSTTATSDFTVTGLQAPMLDPISNISSADILQISGLTYPNARVDIFLKDSNGDVTTQWTRTSPNGSFRIIWEKQLDPDDYTVTAQTTDNTNAKSFLSPEVHLHVNELLNLTLKRYLFNYFPFVVSIAAIVVGLLYLYRPGRIPFWRRTHELRRRLTHAQLHEQFDTLKSAVTEEMLALQHAKTKRQLTFEEEHFLSRFNKLLDKTERTVEKEIGKM
jgi:hypothetical protein